MIKIEKASKEYKISKSGSGLFSSFTSVLNRKYNVINALDNVSFSVDEGEVIGLLGGNGAGKSTLIKSITGIVELSSGNISINGVNPTKNRREFLKSIGVVFGQRTQLWWELPVIDSYNLIANIYDVKKSTLDESLNRFEKYFDLSSLYSKPVRNLSLGQRVLCDIVGSLIHNPKLVLLDEPTIGLDVKTKYQVRELIKDINKSFGTTFIITSHDMDDIENLSQKIVILKNGKVFYDGCQNEFVQTRSKLYEVSITLKSDDSDTLDSMIETFEGVFTKDKAALSDKAIINLVCDREIIEPFKLISSIHELCEIVSFSVSNPKLEDVMRMN